MSELCLQMIEHEIVQMNVVANAADQRDDSKRKMISMFGAPTPGHQHLTGSIFSTSCSL